MLTRRPNPRAAMPSAVSRISSTAVSILASSARSQVSRSRSRKSPGSYPLRDAGLVVGGVGVSGETCAQDRAVAAAALAKLGFPAD